MTNDELYINALLTNLNEAIEKKDKRSILLYYDLINDFDLDNISDKLFNNYDNLISKANLILYSKEV